MGNSIRQTFAPLRKRKSDWESDERILKADVIALEIPDKYSSVEEFNSKYHNGEIFKFKIGDGIHKYRDLEYAQGLPFPIAIYYKYSNFE